MRNLYTSLSLVMFAGLVHAQCTKDTDCKGNRICERGVCSSPSGGSSSPSLLVTPRLQVPVDSSPVRFEDYPASRHPGPWVIPKGLRRAGQNEWRDEAGKLVEPPRVNFAAKYMVQVHSCGTGCRYYTLTDLSSGGSLDTLKVFAAAEPPPKTSEGYTYSTDLVSRANSNLLVAQYQVDAPGGPECRERAFVLEGEKLRPVTNTKRGCTSY
jgi:hypothetical protein